MQDFITIFLAAPLASAFGVAGLVLGAVWPLFPTRTGMLAAQAGVAAAFTGHYALMGATTGSILNALIAAQALAAIPLGRDPRFRLVYLAMLPAIALVLALTWAGTTSLLSSLATALMSLARWQTRQLPFRLMMLTASPVWGLHDWIIGSLPGIIASTLTVSASLYGLWRVRRDRLRDERAAVRDATAT